MKWGEVMGQPPKIGKIYKVGIWTFKWVSPTFYLLILSTRITDHFFTCLGCSFVLGDVEEASGDTQNSDQSVSIMHFAIFFDEILNGRSQHRRRALFLFLASLRLSVSASQKRWRMAAPYSIH